MLREKVYLKTQETIKARKFHVVPLHEFLPFPTITDRSFWDNSDKDIKAIILSQSKEYLNFQYSVLTASSYRQFYLTGDRAGFEKPYEERRKALAALTLAECFENNGEHIKSIIDGIWCICEESSWVLPAHNFIYEPEAINDQRTLPDCDLQTLDIFASETAILLSMTYYLLKDKLNTVEPLVCKRLVKELKTRTISPFLTRYDYWWMGYSDRRDINNWAPWCIMNCLGTTLLCEADNNLRHRAIVRTMDMLEVYLNGISVDGGCDEGATYWGRSCGMLLEGFDMIFKATLGEISVYKEKKMVNFANYIRKLFIGENYVVNFADGAAKCNPAAELLFTAGIRMKDDILADFGAYCFMWQTLQGVFPTASLSRSMMTLTNSAEMKARGKGTISFEQSSFIKSIEVMVSRQSTRPCEGLFLCAKAGGNNDSHNHNDVGNVVVYYCAQPIIVDIGVEVYRKDFFGENRYNIWTMQSQFHTLPTINGIMQKAGAEFAAKNVKHCFSDAEDNIEMDIAPAYGSRQIKSYIRKASLNRKRQVVIINDTWNLEKADSLIQYFMTPVLPKILKAKIVFKAEKQKISLCYDPDLWQVDLEKYPLTDAKLTASWGEALYRLCFTCKKPTAKGKAQFEIKAE